MPAQPSDSHSHNVRQRAALCHDYQHLSRLVGSPREAIEFRCASVPRLCVYLLGPMPIAQSDVVELGRKARKIDLVNRSSSHLILFFLRSEAPHTSMCQYHSRPVTESFRVDRRGTQPTSWINRLVPAEKWAWEQDRPFKLHRRRLEQDRQIRRQLVEFVPEKRLFPKTPGATVVMITWNDEDRQFHRSDRRTGGRDGRLGSARRIKKIAGN